MKFANRKKFAELPKRRDGSENTVQIAVDRVRISACHACGKVRQIDKTTGFCGVASCRRARARQLNKQVLAELERLDKEG